MPSIPEFNAPALDIRPSEIGVESTAAAGRRLGVYGSQIAEADISTGRAIAGGVKSVGDAAEQYAAHQNIISLARHGADVMAAGSQSLNAYFRGDDIPDDPNNPGAKKAALDERLNNPAAAKQWLDNTLNPMLEQYQQGAWTEGGQAYATHFTENLRTHLTTAALADQSTGAGLAAKDSLQKMADTTNTAMFKINDLHSVEGFFKQFDGALSAIGKSSPTINANDFARLKEWGEEQKAKGLTTAIQGRIVNGQSYDDLVKSYPQYVKPGENLQFEKQQQFYNKAAIVAQKQEMILNKQLAEQTTKSSINDSFAKNVSVDPNTGHATVSPQFAVDMGKLPVINPADPEAATHAKTWLDWAEAKQKPPPVRDDPMATGLVLSAISNPAASLDDAKVAIAKAEIAKTLTPQTAAQLKQLATDLRSINDPNMKTAMDLAKQKLVLPKVGGIPGDETKYAQFQYDFIHNQYLPAKVSGTLPANALDLSDKNSMISQAIRSTTGGPNVTVPAAIRANGGIAPPLPTYTAPAALQQINSKDEYDKLAPGTPFTHNGKQFIKPAAALAPGQM